MHVSCYTMWLQISQYFFYEEVESMLPLLDPGQPLDQQSITEVMLFDFQDWVIKCSSHLAHLEHLLSDL